MNTSRMRHSLSTKFEKMLINLCLRWHILRSYRFVAEITFKVYAIINCLNENLIAHSRVNTGCFQHQYTDFGHTWAWIWACPNLTLSKTEPTIKHNSSFLTKKNQQHNVNITMRKWNINVMYNLFGLLNDIIGSWLCCNLVD